MRLIVNGEDLGVDYETPEAKPRTRLLFYLSLAGFVSGFSLLNPWVAYVGENDENSVCDSSGRHKGRFASKRRLSVLKNLAQVRKNPRKKRILRKRTLSPPGKQ